METQTHTATKSAPKKRKKVAAKKPQSRAVSTVVAKPPAAPPPRSFLEVVATAVLDPRCDVAKMTALTDLQERIEDRESIKAFTVAFNHLQAELPVINRDGKIDHSSDGGDTTRSGRKALKTRYATYPNLNRVVGPLMKKHGFTFMTSMNPDPSGAMIAVSTLRHIGGHSQSTSFRVTADATGGKNNQQGWGSSQQYAMRYNMIALLNIVTEAREDADNDGFPGPGENVSAAQLAALVQLKDASGADVGKFCELMGVDSMAEIPATRFMEAKQQLERKLRAKKPPASDFPGDK